MAEENPASQRQTAVTAYLKSMRFRMRFSYAGVRSIEAANRGGVWMFFKAEHVMRMRSLVPKAATYQTCAVVVRDH